MGLFDSTARRHNNCSSIAMSPQRLNKQLFPPSHNIMVFLHYTTLLYYEMEGVVPNPCGDHLTSSLSKPHCNFWREKIQSIEKQANSSDMQ